MVKIQSGVVVYTLALFVVLFFSNNQLRAQQADSILSHIQSIKDDGGRIDAIYKNTSKIATLDPVKLIALWSLLKEVNRDGKDLSATAHGYTLRGLYHGLTGSSDSIMHYKLLAVKAFRHLPASAQKVLALNSISSNYYYQGQLDKYLAYNDTAYQITQQLPVPNKDMELMILFNRTPVLFELNKVDEAYAILKNIERELAVTDLDGFKGKLALRLYYHFRHLNVNQDSSLYYAKKSLYYAKLNNDNSYMTSSYSAIGSCYSGISEYTLATIYLDSALAANKHPNDHETYLGLQFDRLTNYKHLGDFEKADNIWKQAMETVEREGLGHWKLTLLNERVLFYEAKGDYKSALAANRVYEAFKDSVKSADLKEKLAEMEVKHQSYEKDVQLEKFAREKEIADAELRLIYILGFSIVLILIVVIFFTRRNSKLHQTLTEEKQKTLELELEKKASEEARLVEENERQKNQLSTRALEVGQRNGILLDVYEQIKLLQQKGVDEQQVLISNLHQQIGSYMRSGEDWKRIRVQLEEVNSALTQKIKEAYPQLTGKDLRMLMLFKLGLNTKEIANLLSLAPSSVKMSRYRLKKKLNLEKTASLEEFLQLFEETNL